VQATHFLSTGQRRLETGPWDEDLLWLFGPQALEKPVNSAPRSDLVAPVGGYLTLRSTHGFAFTRAAKFRHRPAQADMLHVDIWWRGLNIALDPGTYSYNSAAPWNNSLSGTRYHNTVTVDSLDQMDRAGRFLWLPWLRGASLNNIHSKTGHLAAWEGTHNGYLRLQDPVWYRRSLIRLGDDHWLIIDSLSARKVHEYRLHWLLIDAPHQFNAVRQTIDLQTACGNYRIVTASDSKSSRCRLDRGDAASPVGWRSKYYHHREPALAVSTEDSVREIVFATLLGPQAQTVSLTGNCVCATGSDWSVIVRMNLSARRRPTPLIEEIQMTGSFTDAVTSRTTDVMR
jgi:asparagine synthase (glutamine-hydrolysing)